MLGSPDTRPHRLKTYIFQQHKPDTRQILPCIQCYINSRKMRSFLQAIRHWLRTRRIHGSQRMLQHCMWQSSTVNTHSRGAHGLGHTDNPICPHSLRVSWNLDHKACNYQALQCFCISRHHMQCTRGHWALAGNNRDRRCSRVRQYSVLQKSR